MSGRGDAEAMRRAISDMRSVRSLEMCLMPQTLRVKTFISGVSMGTEVAPAAREDGDGSIGFDARDGREKGVITAHGEWAGENVILSIDAE